MRPEPIPAREPFDGAISKWAAKFINHNNQLWRVRGDYDADDLMQEAFLIYAKLDERYPDVIDRPHFMRLFQVSFRNHIHRLARNRSRRREMSLFAELPSGDVIADLLECSDDEFQEVAWALMVADAPSDVRRAVEAIEAQEERPAGVCPVRWVASLARLPLFIDPERDVLSKMLRWLEAEPCPTA